MMSSNSIFTIRPFSFILYTFQTHTVKMAASPNMFQKTARQALCIEWSKCTFELRNTKLHKPNSWRNNSSIKFNIGIICKLYIRYLPGGVTRRRKILFIKAIHNETDGGSFHANETINRRTGAINRSKSNNQTKQTQIKSTSFDTIKTLHTKSDPTVKAKFLSN